MSDFKYSLIVLYIGLGIVGCSTGGAADVDNSQLNGGLSGKFFLGGDGEGWKMDLTTGEYSRIPGVDWENTGGDFHAQADFYAYPIEYSNDEFLLKIGHCQRSDNPEYPSYYDDCLGVYDSNGNLVESSTLFEDIWAEPKLSRDGQRLAFFYDNQVDGIAPALVVATRNFEPISAIPIPGYNVSPSLSWLPDGRVVYDRQQGIYITTTDYSSSSPIIEFEEFQGQPKQVTVSPDGNKIAFVLQTDATFRTRTATLWTINVDGTELQQLARVSESQRPSFENPTWSPDGRYIAFTHGRVAAASNTDLGLIGGAYVIPSDSDTILLTDDNPNIIHIQSYFGMKQNRTNVELTTDFSIKEGTMAWLPD